MAYTKEVVCPHCNGAGKVYEYTAKDILFGTDEVPDHTFARECGVCLGQGHICVNPEPETPKDV